MFVYMLWCHPRVTRTDTFFPYTAGFRARRSEGPGFGSGADRRGTEDGLQAGFHRHGGRAPETPDAIDTLGRKIHVRGKRGGKSAHLDRKSTRLNSSH